MQTIYGPKDSKSEFTSRKYHKFSCPLEIFWCFRYLPKVPFQEPWQQRNLTSQKVYFWEFGTLMTDEHRSKCTIFFEGGTPLPIFRVILAEKGTHIQACFLEIPIFWHFRWSCLCIFCCKCDSCLGILFFKKVTHWAARPPYTTNTEVSPLIISMHFFSLANLPNTKELFKVLEVCDLLLSIQWTCQQVPGHQACQVSVWTITK